MPSPSIAKPLASLFPDICHLGFGVASRSSVAEGGAEVIANAVKPTSLTVRPEGANYQ